MDILNSCQFQSYFQSVIPQLVYFVVLDPFTTQIDDKMIGKIQFHCILYSKFSSSNGVSFCRQPSEYL